MEKRQELTWRELLGQIIVNIHERQRLAKAASVHVATLQRWVRAQTMPREEHLQHLLAALPEDVYTAFLHLAAVDFPNLLHLNEYQSPEAPPLEIPTAFYRQILGAFSLTPWPIHYQAVLDLILQQLVDLLDSDRHGLAISLVRCMPPDATGQVLSLHEVGGMGTHPWKHDLEQKQFFFGAESLVGHAVTSFASCVVNSRDELTFYPAHWTDYENSAAALPVLRHARVAGGLVASSAHEGFFTEAKVALLERYANLASLLFDTGDFYSGEALAFRMMPRYTQQIPLFSDFQQRLTRKFTEALSTQRQITLHEARLAVWRDLEAEMLTLPWNGNQAE